MKIMTLASPLVVIILSMVVAVAVYDSFNKEQQLPSAKKWEDIRKKLGDTLKTIITLIPIFDLFLTPGTPAIFPTQPKIELGTAIRVKVDAWLGWTVFYTLDGSDPQDNGLLYKGGILLDRNIYLNQYVTITVRSYFFGVWSQPVSHTYFVAAVPQCGDNPKRTIKFLHCPGVPNTPTPLVEGAVL